MKYLDFDLLLERSRDRFKARVINSPAGQAESDFSLPFSEIELENFLLKIGRPLRQVRRVESMEIEAAKKFGGSLFEAVFNNEVRACFRSSLDDAERLGMGLRLRLRMTNTPELTDLPWEYLYNSSLNRFLSLAQETPIIRYLELPERVRSIKVIPPLSVLVMISSPHDYPKLDVEREWTKLKEVLGPLEQQGLVALERQDKATLSALQRMLRQKEFHIFHFIGHGGFDKQSQDGVLILEDEEGRGRAVSGQYLGTLLHNHHPLRLVILNACEGGRTSRTDPFAGTAQSLVQQGIPAVIAMQFEISDEAAITFTQEFYPALTDSYPVDAALVEARTAIFAYGNNVEWGTPVLYMRSPDGQIFNIANVEKSATLPPETSRHPVVPASTKELPPELLQAIAHPISEVRESAVKVLEGLLHGVHKEVGLRAEAALKKLAEDDSRKVAAAAKACLARYAEAINTQRAPSASAATDVDGMITIDERGIIERFNIAAERIFGYSTEEVLNKSVSMLMPSPYRELHDGYVANYVKTGEKKIIGLRREVYGRRKDGTTFPMDIAVNEVFDGNRRNFMAIMQDITARKQAEEQLQKTKDAAEAAQKAEKLAAEKTRVEAEAAEAKPAKVKKSSSKALWVGIAAVLAIGIVGGLLGLQNLEPVTEDNISRQVSATGRSTVDDSTKAANIAKADDSTQTGSQFKEEQPKQGEEPTGEKPVTKTPGEEASAIPPKKAEDKNAKEAVRNSALASQKEMDETKQQVPGDEKDKNANPNHTKAGQIKATGEMQLRSGDAIAAKKSFDLAKNLYNQAAEEMTSMLKRVADAAKNSMREAKDKTAKDSYASDTYQQATSIEKEADNAFRENNFDKAEDLYKKAQELYISVANEAAEKLGREQRGKETARREIQSLINGFKAMFESENLQVLKISYKEPEIWSTFFKNVEKIHVTIVNHESEIGQNQARVILNFQLDYEQKGVKQNTPVSKRIWSLEEKGDKWAIVSMQEQ